MRDTVDGINEAAFDRAMGTPRRRRATKAPVTGRWSVAKIRERLLDQGYSSLVGREEEIQAAEKSGALLWTRDRITTTDRSAIDARPSQEG